MNSTCLTKTNTKSPFLIGVAGGTACGKVCYFILWLFMKWIMLRNVYYVYTNL